MNGQKTHFYNEVDVLHNTVITTGTMELTTVQSWYNLGTIPGNKIKDGSVDHG